MNGQDLELWRAFFKMHCYFWGLSHVTYVAIYEAVRLSGVINTSSSFLSLYISSSFQSFFIFLPWFFTTFACLSTLQYMETVSNLVKWTFLFLWFFSSRNLFSNFNTTWDSISSCDFSGPNLCLRDDEGHSLRVTECFKSFQVSGKL